MARKVGSDGFFVNDHRPEGKFFHVAEIVQPIVKVKADGTFLDPEATITVQEDFPFLDITAQAEADAVVGNVAYPLGAAAQVWEIRSVTLTSAAGGNYSVEDDGVVIGHAVAVALGALEELVQVPLPVVGGSDITINGGLAADAWNIRAVRL